MRRREESTLQYWVGKHDENKPLRRNRRKWEDNIKEYLQSIELGGLNWVHLAHRKEYWRTFVNAVKNLWVF